MRSVFFPRLVNGPFGDPALYVRMAHHRRAFLFDCGELQALSTRELLCLEAVFISHAHIDHLAGFDRLLRTLLDRGRALTLFGPAGFDDQMAARLQGYTWNLTRSYSLVLEVFAWDGERLRGQRFRASRAFRAEPLAERPCADGRLWESPLARVRAAVLAHGAIPSLAFVLEEPLHIAIHQDRLAACSFVPGRWLTAFKDRLRAGEPLAAQITVPHAGQGPRSLSLGEVLAQIAHLAPGMKVAYVTDASPSESNAALIRGLARGAQLLAIEAAFAGADRDQAEQKNHLTAPLAGTLAREAGAGRLLVFHHSPRYLEEPERLRREAEQAFQGAGAAEVP